MIKKLLIANRGEIAARIIRTCKDMDIRSVAIFSDCDAKSLAILLADEAYALDGLESSQTYLNQDKIIQIAKRSGADAIHPGFGFLSENAGFAKKCQDAGIIFVGPSHEAIRAMGDKVESRQLASNAGVPLAEGTPPIETNVDLNKLEKTAEKIGYPVLIKCSAGGGGHGMRLVEGSADLASAIRGTRSEGEKSFGDGTIYLEKAIVKPRHIEVQVFGLPNGEVIHMYTRACSVQRRYQKVIEEAPAPEIPEKVAESIQAAAVSLAKAINYKGAGTVEFLLDTGGQFYFLEMNTRLQVEHTVTESILGVDLVEWQLRTATNDDSLNAFAKSPLEKRGHAIQCRLYAEEPLSNFAPSPGKLWSFREPSGLGIRVDSGVYEGSDIPIYYDPMIAKVVAYGDSREVAVKRMLRCLDETFVGGIACNISFLKAVIASKAFQKGDYPTSIIEDEKIIDKLKDLNNPLHNPDVVLAAMAVGFVNRQKRPLNHGRPLSPWQKGTTGKFGSR